MGRLVNVLLLVVFAFTRPYFTTAGKAAEAEGSRSTVILLDASLSMRRAGLFEAIGFKAGAWRYVRRLSRLVRATLAPFRTSR